MYGGRKKNDNYNFILDRWYCDCSSSHHKIQETNHLGFVGLCVNLYNLQAWVVQ